MNIYWDIENQRIVAGLNSRSLVTQFNFFLRDTIPVDLILCAPQANVNQPYSVQSLDVGDSIRFGAKAAVTDSAFLFSCASWVASGSGTTQKYTGSFQMNTAALIAALGSLASLAVKAEFTIVQPDNSHALTTQFSIVVYPDVIIGTEGVPVTAFNVVEQFTDSDGIAKVRLVNSLGQTCFIGSPL